IAGLVQRLPHEAGVMLVDACVRFLVVLLLASVLEYAQTHARQRRDDLDRHLRALVDSRLDRFGGRRRRRGRALTAAGREHRDDETEGGPPPRHHFSTGPPMAASS